MKIAVNFFEEIKAHLSSEYWAGCRWVAYDSKDAVTHSRQVQCFTDYNGAAACCEQWAAQRKTWRTRVLADILKVLHKGPEVLQPVHALLAVEEVVERYPITSFLAGDNIATHVLSGSYYPVIWNKRVQPLQAIEHYHLISHQFPDTEHHTVRHRAKVVESVQQFPEAVQLFELYVRQHQAAGRAKPNFFLIGQWKGQSLQLNEAGLPLPGGGLLLYAAYAVYDRDSQDKFYRTGPVQEVTETITLSSVVVVRLNDQGSQLNFYNGSLKKIAPGISQEYMDLRYFDFQGSVKVVPIQ